jgi:hypothetical protein
VCLVTLIFQFMKRVYSGQNYTFLLNLERYRTTALFNPKNTVYGCLSDTILNVTVISSVYISSYSSRQVDEIPHLLRTSIFVTIFFLDFAIGPYSKAAESGP